MKHKVCSCQAAGRTAEPAGVLVHSGRLCLSSLDPYRPWSNENIIFKVLFYFFTEEASCEPTDRQRCEKIVTITFEGLLLRLCDNLHILLKEPK